MNKLIAVVGMAGSGKSIASDYLEDQGWTKIYFGGVIYKLMNEQGIEITPESQKKFREKLRQEQGMDIVAKTLLKDIENAYQKGNTILDGVYSWDEYKTLHEHFGDSLKLICICCDKKIRYKRIGKRAARPFTKQEIIQRDITEIENSAKGGPIAFADYYLFNNGDLAQYIHRLNEIINLIDNEGEM